jgi:hypothetical protein
MARVAQYHQCYTPSERHGRAYNLAAISLPLEHNASPGNVTSSRLCTHLSSSSSKKAIQDLLRGIRRSAQDCVSGAGKYKTWSHGRALTTISITRLQAARDPSTVRVQRGTPKGTVTSAIAMRVHHCHLHGHYPGPQRRDPIPTLHQHCFFTSLSPIHHLVIPDSVRDRTSNTSRNKPFQKQHHDCSSLNPPKHAYQHDPTVW